MTGGNFGARLDELERQVGTGTLSFAVEFDQVYAKIQEVRDDFKHPRGGQAHYARDGLLMHTDEYLQTIADHFLEDPVKGCIEAVEVQARRSENLAPVEYVNLRRSAHPTVTDDGAIVYDRPPDVPRLSDDELDAQRRHGHGLDYGESTRPRL